MKRTMIGLLLISSLGIVAVALLFAKGDFARTGIVFAVWLTVAILIISAAGE